jgi:hypothetical protein
LKLNEFFFKKDTYKLEEMLLTIKFFREIDICERNWSNDPRINYKPPFNLVKLIEKKFNFEKELEEFEGSLKQDELLDI